MIKEFDYKDFLRKKLLERTRANPAYSQRAFAKNLGMAPGALSEIMAGKRSLSLKSALKVANNLGLNPQDTQQLLLMAQRDKRPEGSLLKREMRRLDLSLDMFEVVSHWYYFALLNLSDCEGFQWNYRWIAKALGITIIEAKDAVERMRKVGLLEQTSEGLKVVADFVLSPNNIPSAAVRNYHRQILLKAMESLEGQSIIEREISGLGIALNKEDVAAIKKEISQFKSKIVKKYSSGKKKMVYQLEIAFFRLSQE